MKLHIVQALHGDCFILEYGKMSNKHFALIDGGPRTVYRKFLKPSMQKIIGKSGKLDLVVPSHIDRDHVSGLLDLFKEIRKQKKSKNKQLVDVQEIWQNTFDMIIGYHNGIISKPTTVSKLAKSKSLISNTNLATRSIQEGNDLKILTGKLDIPQNRIFRNNIITVENHSKTITLQDMKLKIVGPTKNNLQELRKEWIKYLRSQKKKPFSKTKKVAEYTDKSIPNLSSIMFLINTKGQSILFTGNGRGDHIIQGLKKQKLLNSQGKIHVNFLKMPHHESDKNIEPDFFRTITADSYIISANGGKSNNPDLTTLELIVDLAICDKRKITIYLTNETPSTRQLIKNRPESKFGYKLKIMPKNKTYFTVEI